LSLDEVSLSDGDLYTVLTNTRAKCQKGVLIAMVKGVKSEDVCKIFNLIPEKKRKIVMEVTVDMANNMEKMVKESFPNATIVTDRFHVQQLPDEALQEMRIKYRWEAIDEENKAIEQSKKKGEKYYAPTFENGDSKKQLLARSRYLLFKPSNKWSESQKARADILFREYPWLKKAYELSMMFRSIYEHSKTREEGEIRLSQWFDKIEKYNFPSFITAANSIKNHKETILNYFHHRSTNALAEAFNAKIKAFRSVFRGVKDTAFFLYRVA
jgi:transposase